MFSIVFAFGGLFTFFLLRYMKKSGDSLRTMREAAYRDFLTGLYNARAFEVLLQQKIESFSRYSIPFTLLLVDIDHFKQVNDTYGHAAGDAVLSQFADLLRDTFRPDDKIARKGGRSSSFLSITATGTRSQKSPSVCGAMWRNSRSCCRRG